MIILWLVHRIVSKLEQRVDSLEERLDKVEARQSRGTIGWDESWALEEKDE